VERFILTYFPRNSRLQVNIFTTIYFVVTHFDIGRVKFALCVTLFDHATTQESDKPRAKGEEPRQMAANLEC
jgi:hypothetical protein